jgi:hypothetical protein
LSKDVQVQALGHQIKGLVFSNTSTTTKDELAAAKKEFETALALNPNLVPSLIGEANILLNELITKRVSNIKTATQPAMDMAQRILLLDKNNPYAFAIFAKAYALRGQKDTYDKYAALALDAARKSTTLPAQAKKDFERIFATGKNKPIVKINSIKIISSGTGTTTKVAPK